MNQSDIIRLRADTPCCSEGLHFNNAGAGLQPKPVFRPVTSHLELEYRIGGYEAKAQSQEKIDHFYTTFATLLNCQPEEIARPHGYIRIDLESGKTHNVLRIGKAMSLDASDLPRRLTTL